MVSPRIKSGNDFRNRIVNAVARLILTTSPGKKGITQYVIDAASELPVMYINHAVPTI